MAVINIRPSECSDPSAALKQYPCLQCLSEKELKAVLVLALAEAVSDTVPEILEASKCLTCLSPKQRLQSLVSILGGVYLSGSTVTEIREDIKCLICGSDTMIDSALLYEICKLFTSLSQ